MGNICYVSELPKLLLNKSVTTKRLQYRIID